MTTVHPDDGQFQAFLDGELSLDRANVVERHLLRCPDCRERVAALQESESQVGKALRLLDPATDMDSARWEARRRWAARRSASYRKRLAAAAVAILFLGAGAAAAMPGSPVRAWLAGDGPTPGSAVASEERGAAVSIGLVDGRARLELERGVRLELRAGTGERMLVEAPAGGAFDTGSGWVRVTGHGSEEPVRLELPGPPHGVEVRVGGDLRLEVVDGVMYVAGTDGVRVPDAEWLPVDLGESAAQEEGESDGD
jgi:hypothetical protein